jgi:hypothetical protein
MENTALSSTASETDPQEGGTVVKSLPHNKRSLDRARGKIIRKLFAVFLSKTKVSPVVHW